MRKRTPRSARACPLSSQSRLGRSLALVQFIRREKKTALLVDARLTVREPRSQSSGEMVDHLVRLCRRARSPPLPLAWRGADGAVVEKRGLQGVGTMRQSLVGIRCTSTARAAQRLEGCDVVVALLTPLLVDSALGLVLQL